MKKIFVLIVISLFLITSCGEKSQVLSTKKTPILEKRMDEGKVKIYDSANGEFYTGYLEETGINKNGITYISEKKEMKNGINHGSYEGYHENGVLREKATFKNGILEGNYQIFNYYGEKLEEFTYEDGKKSGVYYKNDFFENEIVEGYLENGNFIGEKLVFYKNGQLKKSMVFNNNNELEGKYSEYDDLGNQLELKTYKNGILNGFFMRRSSLDPNYIVDQGFFYNGKKEGKFRDFSRTENYPIISLSDYKKQLEKEFTLKKYEEMWAEEPNIEYYASGQIKTYNINLGAESIGYEYDEDFKINNIDTWITQWNKEIEKAKYLDEIENFDNNIFQLESAILGFRLNKNLTNEEILSLERVSSNAKSLMLNYYVKQRTIAANVR